MAHRIANCVKAHRVSLGVLLAAYGAFYLSTVIMSGWNLADWGIDATTYPPSSINTLLPRSFISPIFFLTSFPTLLIGAIMLCTYSIRGISQAAIDSKEHIAILLTAFGFAYIVIGAWPLQSSVDFAWEWQKQIVSYGPVFAWILYILSLCVLATGAMSLFIHSKINRQKYEE